MITDMPSIKLTQGTIFTCAAAEDYQNCDVKGIIITARCDVAHGKAPIISYVPIVTYRDWLHRDGARIIASRAMSAANGNMKNCIKEAGLAESILDTLSLGAIEEYLNQSTDKQGKNIAKRFSEAFSSHKQISCTMDDNNSTDLAKLIDNNSKLYKQLAQEILSNSVADFHYIDRSEPDEACDGYIALMREIRYMPSELASYLERGIEAKDFARICQIDSRYADKLCISNADHYAMPISLMKSPFIELFMQRLTQLFSRIGVSDYSEETLKRLRSIVLSMKET